MASKKDKDRKLRRYKGFCPNPSCEGMKSFRDSVTKFEGEEMEKDGNLILKETCTLCGTVIWWQRKLDLPDPLEQF